MGNNHERWGRLGRWIRTKYQTPEMQASTPSGVTFQMAGIRDEFNMWKDQFSLRVQHPVLPTSEAHRTSEMFAVGFQLRLLTNIIADRVRANEVTASYEGIEVGFFGRERQQQPFTYIMTFDPRLTSFVFDNKFYQLGDELQIVPESDVRQARPLRTDEMKNLQARLTEVIDSSETIQVSEHQTPK